MVRLPRHRFATDIYAGDPDGVLVRPSLALQH